jgi:hypothetical protein
MTATKEKDAVTTVEDAASKAWQTRKGHPPDRSCPGDEAGGSRTMSDRILLSCPHTEPAPPRAPTRIFSGFEKRCLQGATFRNLDLDLVDFTGADLRNALFEDVALCGCDFGSADLRGARFLRCDLRRARFARSWLGSNSFHGSWLLGAHGLSLSRRKDVERSGGVFLRMLDGGSGS